MMVGFYDGIGPCYVRIDQHGISFADGKVYFSDGNGKDYCIPVEQILTIQPEE